jgi:hypothetical protein
MDSVGLTDAVALNAAPPVAFRRQRQTEAGLKYMAAEIRH